MVLDGLKFIMVIHYGMKHLLRLSNMVLKQLIILIIINFLSPGINLVVFQLRMMIDCVLIFIVVVHYHQQWI